MLRIYADSNVYRLIVPTHPNYKEELHSTFEAFRDKFIFCFSDAHLDDLKTSKEEYREKDVDLMGKYVRDNYYSYDPVSSKQFECYRATPKDAFASKDYEAAKRVVANPFDFDSLFSDIDDFPELQAMNSLMKSYFDLPIAVLGPTIDTSTVDEKGKEWLDRIMPDYHPMMSIKELINNMMPFGAGLLQDKKEVTKLRSYIREYLDRDIYSFEKWGLEFNEKFKQTGIGKTYLEMIDSMLTHNQKQDFYLRFSYAYTMLEMYNITQERKSDGGLKKFNYDSLNTDALHAYYGSFCDYLITDDKGLQVKANILYQLFDFPTKVLSIEDFINLRSQLAGREESQDGFFEALKYDIKHSLQLRERVDLETGSKINTYKTSHIYFNYFNRMQIVSNEPDVTIILYCERSGHGNFIMYREAELLVKKMIEAFGMDDELKGAYDFGENDRLDDEEIIRKWTKSKIIISFSASHKKGTGGVFLSLFIDFINH
jgi:hypothetical protein